MSETLLQYYDLQLNPFVEMSVQKVSVFFCLFIQNGNMLIDFVPVFAE